MQRNSRMSSFAEKPPGIAQTEHSTGISNKANLNATCIIYCQSRIVVKVDSVRLTLHWRYLYIFLKTLRKKKFKKISPSANIENDVESKMAEKKFFQFKQCCPANKSKWRLIIGKIKNKSSPSWIHTPFSIFALGNIFFYFFFVVFYRLESKK
jgi:hypothetical protein